MASEIQIHDALSLQWPIIDVRSPAEFQKGHIPGAVNIPLFSNDERARVGTAYKRRSPEAAKELGYEFVTPKLENFITDSIQAAPGKEVVVHCWRGGMRSQSFAKHLADNGFHQVKIIQGGYKAFRNHLLNSLAKPVQLNILGGFTGSGKTYILQELKKLGEQVIDLEGLANHKGSAFGGIGQGQQPTTEQFQNNIFHEWDKLDLQRPVWLEDESLNVGSVKLPLPLFERMRAAKLYFIDIPKEERAKHLVEDYAVFKNEQLAESIHKISKRIGGLNEKKAIDHLENENYFEVAMIALHYYDKSYLKGMKKRDEEKVTRISLDVTDHYKNALTLRTHLKHE